jgi:hypothetical protein
MLADVRRALDHAGRNDQRVGGWLPGGLQDFARQLGELLDRKTPMLEPAERIADALERLVVVQEKILAQQDRLTEATLEALRGAS